MANWAQSLIDKLVERKQRKQKEQEDKFDSNVKQMDEAAKKEHDEILKKDLNAIEEYKKRQKKMLEGE